MKNLVLLVILVLLLSACDTGTETTVGPFPIETEPVAEENVAEPTSTPDSSSPSTDSAGPAADTWSPPVPWPDTAVASGTIAVDAGQSFGRVSPYVFGSNYGPWVAVPFELLDAAAASGITMLRWPGGEWGDRNNIQEIQLDRFVTFARQMGAEPTISVRLRDGTPEQAAELVRYANIEKGYGIKYWSVGNEPNLYPDYDVERFLTEWRATAEAILAVDPDIVLLGPEVSQFTGGEAPGPSDAHLFLDRFLEENGDLVDIVTVHRYPFGSVNHETNTFEELSASTAEWDRLIPDLRERVRRLTGRDLPVGVTEINTHWTHDTAGETTPDSYYNAVWLADVLGRMIRQRVDIVNHFVLVTKDNQGGWGILSDRGLRPSYYTYRLFSLFGEELVYAGANDDDQLGAYAARRDDGTLTVLIVNRGSEAAETTLSLAGHAGGGAEIYRLTAERAADGTADQPAETITIQDGATLALPAQSVTLLIVE